MLPLAKTTRLLLLLHQLKMVEHPLLLLPLLPTVEPLNQAPLPLRHKLPFHPPKVPMLELRNPICPMDANRKGSRGIAPSNSIITIFGKEV